MSPFPVLRLIKIIAIGMVVLLASSCARYHLVSQESEDPTMVMTLPSNQSDDHLVLRIQNLEDSALYINWERAHFRWPSGFESALNVVPGNKLGFIYSGGQIEYHISPTHYYLGEDSANSRRTSLGSGIAPEGLYQAYRKYYEITVFIPTCRGGAGRCSSANDANWSVVRTAVTIRKL